MGLRVEERIVAGGEGDDVVVHHLVLRGSNRAIGRHLAEVARSRRGFLTGGAPAASAIFIPPERAASGHPLVARELDLAAPAARALPAEPAEPPSPARPYVLELHPDEGYPSLAVCASDLPGGALDGVNAEGLVVVAAPAVDPAAAPGLAALGEGELRVVRRLLDACAGAVAARDALLGALYEGGRPARWLVADRRGDAFVLEAAPGRRFVQGGGAAGAPLAARAAGAPAVAALRTLWRGVYDAVERTFAARFFLGGGRAGRGEAADAAFRLG